MSTGAATDQAKPTEAVILIRMLPPREVSPNWTGRLKQRWRAVAEFRAEAAKATRHESTGLEHFVANFNPVVLDAEIAWCCGRKSVDPTNAPALLKAAIDGIADVIWDNQDSHVRIGEIRQTRGPGTVTVTLRPAS